MKNPLNKVPLKALQGTALALEFGDSTYEGEGNWIVKPADQTTLTQNFGSIMRHLSDLQNLNGTFTLGSVHNVDVASKLYSIDHLIARLLIVRAIFIKEVQP